MPKRPIQFFLPAQRKAQLQRDIEARGLSFQQVLEHLADRELDRLSANRSPSYARLAPLPKRR